MFFCCLPFRRRGRKPKENENFFSDDFYRRQRLAEEAKSPPASPSMTTCQCVRLGRADSSCGCDYAIPTSAAALMRCRARQNVGARDTTDGGQEGYIDEIDGSLQDVSLYKPPSSSVLSYVTAPNAENGDAGNDTFVDAASQGSIDVAEASNIAITDRKEFYDTVCDSPLKYQDRFGRSQSMRRYSSAIADRIAMAATGRSPVSGDNQELDLEPLELSRNQTDDTLFSETMLEAGPSTTTIISAAVVDAIDKFNYVEELRYGLRHVADDPTSSSADLSTGPAATGSVVGFVARLAAGGFPNFNNAEDIGRFLNDGQKPPAGGLSNALFGTSRAWSSLQSKRRHCQNGANDATIAGATARRNRASSEPRKSARRLAD